jgi:hypothetical protein
MQYWSLVQNLRHECTVVLEQWLVVTLTGDQALLRLALFAAGFLPEILLDLVRQILKIRRVTIQLPRQAGNDLLGRHHLAGVAGRSRIATALVGWWPILSRIMAAPDRLDNSLDASLIYLFRRSLDDPAKATHYLDAADKVLVDIAGKRPLTSARSAARRG